MNPAIDLLIQLSASFTLSGIAVLVLTIFWLGWNNPYIDPKKKNRFDK